MGHGAVGTDVFSVGLRQNMGAISVLRWARSTDPETGQQTVIIPSIKQPQSLNQRQTGVNCLDHILDVGWYFADLSEEETGGIPEI